MTAIDRVAIVINPHLPGAPETAEKARAWLEAHGVRVAIGAVQLPKQTDRPSLLRGAAHNEGAGLGHRVVHTGHAT